MTVHWAVAMDVEAVPVSVEGGTLSIPFAVAWEAFGRDQHEYTRGGVHAPLHRRDRMVLAVKEFFTRDDLVSQFKNKLSEFLVGTDDIIKVPLRDIVHQLAESVNANGGRLMAHCMDRDLAALWNGDRFFGTNVFHPSGPHFKCSTVPLWNQIRFVCTRKIFTDRRLNEKFLAKHPQLIDTSLEGLTIAIRGGDTSFHQNHRPQDDIDLLIRLLDHLYTARVSRKDFWDILRLDHDHYDSVPKTVHSLRDTVQVSGQATLKN